jgi:hypothetical protein
LGCLRKNIGDPLAQTLGNLVLATAGDDNLQFGFPVEGLKARRAFSQVSLNGLATFGGELPVQEGVQRPQSVVTLACAHEVLDPILLFVVVHVQRFRSDL